MPKTITDLFFIWSGGKTIGECAKEYNMSKVQVFSTFIDHLHRFREELERTIVELKGE